MPDKVVKSSLRLVVAIQESHGKFFLTLRQYEVIVNAIVPVRIFDIVDVEFTPFVGFQVESFHTRACQDAFEIGEFR